MQMLNNLKLDFLNQSDFFKKFNFKYIILAISIMFVASAASFNAFYSKYYFSEGIKSHSIDAHLNYSAEKPFIYRSMTPDIANILEKITPQSIKEKVGASVKNNLEHWAINPLVSSQDEYSFRYFFFFYFTFIGYLSASGALFWAAKSYGFDNNIASLSTAAFMLCFPCFQAVNGYFYDAWEIAAILSTFAIILNRQWLLLPLIAILGAWNKETYIFALLCFAPYFIAQKNNHKANIIYLFACLLAIATGLFATHRFGANIGNDLITQFKANIAYIASFDNLIMPQIIYKSRLPSALSLFGIIAIALVISSAWKNLNKMDKSALMIAIVLNILLLAIYNLKQGGNNLSFIFPIFFIALAMGIKNIFDNYARPRHSLA